MASYDLIGNIAVIKGKANGKKKTKKQKLDEAKKLLKIPSIKSVVEKIGNVHGRLRVINVKHVAGEKNLIAKHRENDCVFKFDVKTCYFSPRLSGERKKIAGKVKKKNKVLVMFSGIGPFSIIIAKATGAQVTAIELGKDCNKYAKENLKLNHVNVDLIQGDVKKKVDRKLGKFDVVVMARPNLKESFLKWGLMACKKNGKIFYYGFCNIDEKKKMVEDLKKEAEDLKKKIKVMKIVKAGEIAPYKFRYRVEIKVLK